MINLSPQVGLATWVVKDGKVLLGRRGSSSSHAKGVWGLPGGRLEFGESFEECARRETLEESGIKIDSVQFLSATNDFFVSEKKHFVTIFMIAQHISGFPKVLEKNKMENWKWFGLDNLPQPLFSPIDNLFDQGIDLRKIIDKEFSIPSPANV